MSKDERALSLESLGACLREARRDRGMTIAQAAEAAGLHVGTLQRWETGDLEPKILKLAKLAELYEKPLDWFLGRDSHALLAPGNIIVDRDIEEDVILGRGDPNPVRHLDWLPDRTTAFYRIPENYQVRRWGKETELEIKLFERELDKRLPAGVFDAWERIYDTLAALKKKHTEKN